jgi:hypothetical protein
MATVDTYTQDDLTVAADRVVRARANENDALGLAPVELGQRASGVVDPADVDQAAELGASEKTKPGGEASDHKAGTQPKDGDPKPAASVGDGTRAPGSPEPREPQSDPGEGGTPPEVGKPGGPAQAEPEKAGGGER